jgi:hypothetical protein
MVSIAAVWMAAGSIGFAVKALMLSVWAVEGNLTAARVCVGACAGLLSAALAMVAVRAKLLANPVASIPETVPVPLPSHFLDQKEILAQAIDVGPIPLWSSRQAITSGPRVPD